MTSRLVRLRGQGGGVKLIINYEVVAGEVQGIKWAGFETDVIRTILKAQEKPDFSGLGTFETSIRMGKTSEQAFSRAFKYLRYYNIIIPYIKRGKYKIADHYVESIKEAFSLPVIDELEVKKKWLTKELEQN